MTRLLKLVCGLMGITLIITTASLISRRDQAVPVQLALVRVSDWTREISQQQYYLVEPTSSFARPIGPSFEQLTTPVITHNWLYFTGLTSDPVVDRYDTALYRMPLWADTDAAQLVAVNPLECFYQCEMALAPDGQWLVYWGTSPTGDLALYRARPDGRAAERLTPSKLTMPDDFDAPTLAIVGEWVVFTGVLRISPTPTPHVYRMPLAGGVPTDLTPDWPYAALTFVPTGQTDSVVISGEDGNLWALGLQRSSPQSLTNRARLTYPASVAAWLPQHQWLITRTSLNEPNGDWVSVIQLDTQQVLWEANARFGAVSADEQSILTIENGWSAAGVYQGSTLIEIQIANAHQRVVGQAPGYIREVWGWTADRQWILFTVYDAAINHTTLWRIPASGGPPQQIASLGGASFLDAWLADRTGVIYTDYGLMDANFSARINVDGTDPQPLMPVRPEYGAIEFFGWLTLHTRHFRPLALLIMGLGLCVVWALPIPRR